MKNLTDELISANSDRYCPICGSSSIGSDYTLGAYDYDNNLIRNFCVCNDCQSVFTFNYWVRNVYITEDNYNKED